MLEAMVRETGVKVGAALLSDTPGSEHPTYASVIRHNVNAIVEALAP